MKYIISDNVEYYKVEKFDIKLNGLQIIDSSDEIQIYNDPFRTVPLFIAKNKNNNLLIFSNFEEFYKFENIDRTIDEVGFWEISLFDSGLWTRTLYKSVKQMPSATKILISKETNEYSIIRYWDFDIKEDKNIDSLEKAAKGLFDRLDDIFSKLDKNQKYIMGLSGGMDSRLTLAFLSKYIPKENLKLFTYGFDKKILEYKYACEVALAFGFNKPKFHMLTKDTYKEAMNYLPQMSGGQIGINHCHITSFFRNNELQGYKQISTFYSDAILGWDTKNKKFIDSILNNSFVKALDKFDFLSNEIKNNIKIDSFKIFGQINPNYNYSSLNEYKYVTERNQKFHNFMASIQNRFVNTFLPFANYDLLSYAQSIPLKFKHEKILTDFILENFFNTGNIRNISSRFQWGSKFSSLKDWYNFKFLNFSNAILRKLTFGHLQFLNKYQTEEQERLLYRDFHLDLKNSTKKLKALDLISQQNKKYWDKLPLRSEGISERYNFISLANIL